MQIFLSILFICLFIVCIHANFNVTRQTPNATLAVNNTNIPFSIQINQPVNQPTFPARICVCNASTNTSVYQMDVSNGSNFSSNVNYTGNTLTFFLPQYFYNVSNEFYITFEAGVLFSNTNTISIFRNDTQFWHLKVIDSSAATTTSYPSTNTYTGSTFTSMNNTSTVRINNTTITTVTTTNMSTTTNQTVQPIITTTAASVAPPNTGEPPPTRSAQLGMGLGITFISIAIIAEIIYFKYCYSGGDRSGSYYT